MHQEFWHERWQLNQIGFHSEIFNFHLQNFWPALNIALGSRVFVPLCGKSKDMLWLLAQGYDVTGVEFSPLAVEAFLSENGVLATASRQDKFNVSAADGLRIYCGDFFDLSAGDLAGVNAVYDRASLVALPPDMRAAYAAKMRHLLGPETKMLLLAFDYPQHEMPGPPFSVTAQEVQTLYRSWCNVELLHTEDILDREPQFRNRGVSRMQEQVYVLTARG
ncbi:MAG: thiopurine S-methyltransferase [Methylococcales bacterium]|nr:thiopurine S-methyltransferase [Methylococcales bacterium]